MVHEHTHSARISTGISETVLPDPDPGLVAALGEAALLDGDERRLRLAELAAAHPRSIAVWAELSRSARDDVEAYAYARVGYHRGLDQLRGAGWRGTGYVRFEHESNRPFLSALDSLRRLAGRIGETDEEERCRIFLAQLDPSLRDGV